MTSPGPAGSQNALERVLDSASAVFEALLQPYEALADAEPDTPIGAPLPVPDFATTQAVREIIARVVGGGRPGWALEQVEERQREVHEFVAAYRRGDFRESSAANWVGEVREFRDAVLSDLHTAMQAPRGWARIDLGPVAAARHHAGGNDLLTPKDAARELRLPERTVRRRILQGDLGPWRKEGSRWVIARDAFLRHWGDRMLATDAPRPPAANHTEAEVGERLLRLKPESPPPASGAR